MARDPFAPVPQSSVPSWVWIVVGMIAFMLVGIGTTVAIVVNKRSPPPVVATTTPVAKPAVDPAATPTVTAPAGDAKVAANQPAGDGAKTDKGADAADDEKHEKKKKSHKPKTEKPAKAEKPAAAAAPPPKKKSDMSQKDIDKLLGL
jgi:pyruvate/2-oxoglutarate dehydrogenase complex dihydrolipoamide acyltransferase (E2) component